MKKLLLGSAALFATACASLSLTPDIAQPAEVTKAELTAEDAAIFIADAEADLAEFSEYAARIYWNQATNISYDTNWLAAKVGAEYTEKVVGYANATKQFEDLDLPAELARKMQILKSGITLPAPSTDGAAKELADITTGLDATYGTGKFVYKGEELNLEQLSGIIASSRDPEELAAVWDGWRTISPPMKADSQQSVKVLEMLQVIFSNWGKNVLSGPQI